MKKKLISRGYDVIDLKTGAQAVVEACARVPDVAIVDQNLPDMKGLQVARIIKKKHPEISVILLVGYGGADQRQEADAKNVVFQNLCKPCGISELIQAIESARRHRGEAAARREQKPGPVGPLRRLWMHFILKIRMFSK